MVEATPHANYGSGALDVAGYLDASIAHATSFLDGFKRAGDIRATLREQVETDPALAELVRLATTRNATK